MNSNDWHEVKSIVQEALDRPLEQRSDYVARRCGNDSHLSDEVIALLDTEQSLGDFIARPAYLRFIDPVAEDDIYELSIGDRLGRYEITGELGRGGMGAVYLARDEELDRQVAIKVLPAGLYRHPDSAARFLREARIISALNHPNVITIHEIGRIHSIDFIATEFVDGVTLRQRIAAGRITISEAVDICAQVLAALGAAHTAGFIHRDIKPENIIIRSDGLVKVLDFGIAKLTGSPESPSQQAVSESNGLSLSAGTPKYMSPEQLRGDRLDQRSDIWSFGAVLFEMLTGQALAGNRSDVLARWNDGFSGPAAHDQIRQVIERCLDPDLEKRYLSAQEVITDLKKIDNGVPVGTDSTTHRLFHPRLKYLVGTACVMLAILTGAVIYNGSLGVKDPSVSEIRNLAVLPSEGIGASAGEDYFTDGLTDALISDLSQIGELRVISRTSVMRYKGKSAALPQVAQELNVDAVVLSSAQRSGEMVRLSVKLVHATTGRPIWEKGYERSQTNLPVLMKEITRDIAREISIKLTPGENALLSNSRPVDVLAYEEYLKGRFFLNKRNEEALRQAITHFETSIRRDPDFGLAHAFLGDAYFALGTEILSALPPVEALAKGEAAATRAVELDNSLAEAHTSLGVIQLYKWQWGEAEKSLKQAVELNPNYAAAQSWYGLYFVSQGRVGEALARMYRARDLDPLSPHIAQNVGWMLHYAGQHQEEIEQYKRALELDPNFLFARRRLSGAYRQIGQFDAAIEEAEKVISSSGRRPMSLLPLANAYASAGRKAEAEKVLKELLSLRDTHHVSSYALARVYSDLGDKRTAFELLNKAYEERSYAMVFMKVTKDFNDSFRRDPRFADILRKLDLEPHLP